ncbi:hypothetical protein KY328_03005 [Candidatus Woesearchaeota archaeon]|nr:hypothetical protein [Candidatus Woesearchaeota archaeon]MBW3021862.1 hypothetical protein [Candidatus Woesearchaeota archaeon]
MALIPKEPGDIKVAKFKITYAGEHDTKELYKLIHEWLKDHEWQEIQTGNPSDWHEIMYHERVSPSGMTDRWIWWRLEKFSKNRYYKYTINIDFLMLGMSKAQIVHEGRKVKCDNGEINIEIDVKIKLDYKGEWSKHKILTHFRNIFPKRIFKTDLDNHEKELWRETYDLQGAIKKYLHLRGFLAQMEVEPFFISREYAIGK